MITLPERHSPISIMGRNTEGAASELVVTAHEEGAELIRRVARVAESTVRRKRTEEKER